MTQHVSSSARTCFFHLRRIRQVTKHAVVFLFKLSSNLPTRLLQLCPLRSAFSSVLHTAARLITISVPSMPVLHSKSPSSCITSILEPLHHTCHPWLCHALLPGPEDSNHPRMGILL